MDMGHVFVTGAHFKDLRGPPGENKHVVADIVIVDKTDQEAVHPFVYQLKQSTASEVKNSDHFDAEWLHAQQDPFVLMGELVNSDHKQKLLYLTNGQSVSYNHLVVVAGNKGTYVTANQTLEFTAGVQALIEALKIRRKGLMPKSQQRAKATGQSAKSTVFTAIETTEKGVASIAQQSMHMGDAEASTPSSTTDPKLHFQVVV